MSKKAPNDARRWLGEEMMRWAQWVQHQDNASVSRYPSFAGWLVGAAILSDEEAEQLDEALGYCRPKPSFEVVEVPSGDIVLRPPDEPL